MAQPYATAPTSTITSATATGTVDNAPGSNSDINTGGNTGSNPGGMASYYFVFLMLTLCVIGVVVFLNFRRRRKRRLLYLNGQDASSAPHLGTSRARRGWGRWGSTNVSREEGLNEHGEAPPPYVPKSQRPSHEGQRDGGDGPAIPMQTLSREEAGLKPPDYEERYERRVHDDGDDMMRPTRQPEAGGSSSPPPPPRPIGWD